MSSSLPRILGLALILVTGCRLESHPPPGVPAEEAAIRDFTLAHRNHAPEDVCTSGTRP